MKRMKKKRSVTLIEVLVVILLIGMIGGALAFNMRGSLEQGRVFKTEQNISRVYDALMMEYARGELNLNQVVEQSENILTNCPFLTNGAAYLRDAWGRNLLITADHTLDEVKVVSTSLEERRNDTTPTAP